MGAIERVPNIKTKLADPLIPGFMVIQGNHLEELRHLMVSWTQHYPLKPLENEVILVQSNGIAQWLKLALAANSGDGAESGLGIAAGLQVMLPGRFIWQAYRQEFPQLPSASPFDKAPLTWRLLRLLSDLPALAARAPDPQVLQPLQHFLDQDPSVSRTWQLAARLADLYDQYQVYRADWLEAWLQGESVLITAAGERQPLKAEQAWQPLLWQWLNADIRQAHSEADFLSYASRSSVHQVFCQQLGEADANQPPTGFPRRIIVFGISSLPRQTLEVLEVLSQFSQVMLFVCNPSQHYWGDLIEGRELFKKAYQRNSERRVPDNLDEDQLHLHGHPLLAAWGRQGRDYLRLLDERDQPQSYQQHFERIDLFSSPGNETLLQQLQDDILELRTLSERQAMQIQVDVQDRSLSFMLAHSPQREVEILQDQLLAEFEAAQHSGEPLNPRDILVMVPDIQVYAAHIDAVFGKLDRDDPRYLPFHIADQGQRHKAPLLIALESLLHLPESRFSVTELLDLLDVPALRACFELDEVDLLSLKRWIQGANIRWGLDAEQREALDLPEGVSANTWRFGLKRMLLGYASGETSAWQGTVPYAEVAGLEAARLGPLVLLLDQLETAWHTLQQATHAGEWAARLQQLLQDFFVPQSELDQALLLKFEQQLTQWLEAIELAEASDLPLTLDVVREELLSGLDQPGLSQTFLAGSVNFATLMPMRAIPFRQVWLLGMNDGAYPRAVRPVDFDLMAQDYRPGDRSRREDDRYLFLEALLAAREKLVVSWVGRSARDNSVRPPSVLVGQLRDHLQSGWQGQTDDLLNELTIEHPLQPFSRRYFDQDAAAHAPFSYASEWLAVHQPISQAQSPLSLEPWQPETALSLSQLVQLMKQPIDSFYALRLQVPRTESIQVLRDTESFALDGLEVWQLRDRLLQSAILPAVDEDDFLQRVGDEVQRIQQEGLLVEGSLGQLQGQQLCQGLDAVYSDWLAERTEFSDALESQPVMYSAHSEWGVLSVEAMLEPLYQNPETGEVALLLLQSSGLIKQGRTRKWHNHLRGWLMHLLAHQSGLKLTTWIMTPEGKIRFAPLASAEQARACLDRLLQAAHATLQAPTPLSLDTAIAWLANRDDAAVPEFPEGKLQTKLLEALDKSLQQSRFFHQHCTGLEQLWAEGAFVQHAQALYGDFHQAVTAQKETRS
ncbi:exodeoxyribonuclease V subunit gamma [Nitrincola iocasae]|uniref:RecBCD enzyme subunit RecC n=1 Tax=Nitrincola iocasae TaxID=2614693 RepID=A0A5J6LCT3_9GAMM|nr:exodeoxyribonuclease V subunit gamma [Nitrincola iocasae]